MRSEKLTANGERLRNRPSVSVGADHRAARTKPAGRKSLNSATIHYSLFTIHLSLILVPFTLLSAHIETSYWGHMWQRPQQWDSAVHRTMTTGSDSCGTLRVYAPHVYPFLDGYDTREYVPAHSGNITTMVQRIQQASHTPTNSPERADLLTRTNVLARLVAWPEMLKRKDALVAMSLGTNAVWGSSAMDALFETNGAPVQTNFGWTRNPTAKLWKRYDGSGWMPCFRTLMPGTFANDWHGDWCGGVVPFAVAEGAGTINDVNLHEGPYTEGAATPTAFSAYLEDAIYYYHATQAMTFDDVIVDTFDCTNAFVESTYRLYYPLFATASRALALHDRTYHLPGDLVAITNQTDGAAHVRWEAVGVASKKVKVEDGEIELSDPELAAEGEFHVSYTITSTTNWINATNVPCSYVSPRACASIVNLSAGGSGTASNCVSSGSITANDIAGLVGEVYTPGTTRYRLHAIGGGLGGVTYWVTSDSATSSTQVASIVYPTNGEYKVTMTGFASTGYNFRKALDLAIQPDPTVYWLYPSNTTFLSGCDHTFIQSFASVQDYKGNGDYGEWGTIDFNYGDGLDWENMNDYGYQSTRTQNAQPSQYVSNLYGALSSAQFKCRAVVGNDFDTNPYAHCGITDADAKNLLDGIGNWSAAWHVQVFGEAYSEEGCEFEFDMGPPPRMTPEQINLYTVTIGISGSADGETHKYPRSVDTRVKGIIQADWNFPQLKLIQDEN